MYSWTLVEVLTPTFFLISFSDAPSTQISTLLSPGFYILEAPVVASGDHHSSTAVPANYSDGSLLAFSFPVTSVTTPSSQDNGAAGSKTSLPRPTPIALRPIYLPVANYASLANLLAFNLPPILAPSVGGAEPAQPSVLPPTLQPAVEGKEPHITKRAKPSGPTSNTSKAPAKPSRSRAPVAREHAGEGGAYKRCRKFILTAVATSRDDIVRIRESCKHEGFLTFEVVNIVKLCREVMTVRETALKGKWLATVQEAHSNAMQYLISAACKRPIGTRGSQAAEFLNQLQGKLLTYAHDKKQRKAWEAFKEFLKR